VPVTDEDFPGNEELKQARPKVRKLLDAYQAGTLTAAIAFPEVELLDARAKKLESQRDEFKAAHSAPVSPLRRSSDALDELLELRGQFLRVTPALPSTAGARVGESDDDEPSKVYPSPARNNDRVQELPFAATDEETAELNKLLRGEFQWVAIRKGKPGRQSAERFASRIDPLWR